MRRVVGRQVVEMSERDFAALRAGYRAVLLDVGTGDGKHTAQLARRDPGLLVVGLDANRDNMRKASARAAASPDRGGLPNALYVWAAAERLPPALRGVAALHVLMPWGSLLRGLLGADPALLRGLAAACRPGAEFLVTLNLHAWRPPVPEVGGLPEPTPDSARAALAARYAAAGWLLTGARYLDAGQIAALATSWTRRLTPGRGQFDVLELSGAIDPSQPVDATRA